MILDGVLFLAARTARSQAYAQAMNNAGLQPGSVIIFGGSGTARPGQLNRLPERQSVPGIFTPDLSIPLEITCTAIGQRCDIVDAVSVGDDTVGKMIEERAPSLIVYSGYGGELVPAEMCLRWRWLHVHSGWLPDYRGSTTIYYSLLRDKSCGVSAILLAPSIDTGPVLKRKKYPPPPKGVDIDYGYDSAIRADLLVTVLTEFGQTGEFRDLSTQDEAAGETYFVIHPVLKNLALLKCGAGRDKLEVPEVFQEKSGTPDIGE